MRAWILLGLTAGGLSAGCQFSPGTVPTTDPDATSDGGTGPDGGTRPDAGRGGAPGIDGDPAASEGEDPMPASEPDGADQSQPPTASSGCRAAPAMPRDPTLAVALAAIVARLARRARRNR